MDGMTEYDQNDALGLAEVVRKGETTAAELCEEAIARQLAVMVVVPSAFQRPTVAFSD
jgi:hypothetical protein